MIILSSFNGKNYNFIFLYKKDETFSTFSIFHFLEIIKEIIYI